MVRVARVHIERLDRVVPGVAHHDEILSAPRCSSRRKTSSAQVCSGVITSSTTTVQPSLRYIHQAAQAPGHDVGQHVQRPPGQVKHDQLGALAVDLVDRLLVAQVAHIEVAHALERVLTPVVSIIPVSVTAAQCELSRGVGCLPATVP